MKRLIYSTILLLLVVIPLLLTSCEKDKPLSETMIGKWEVEYITEFLYKNNVLISEYKQYLDAGEIQIQFVAGGTGIYSASVEDFLFSWTLSGSSLIIEGLSEESLEWDLKMEGDKLVWSYGGTDPEDSTIRFEDFFTAKRIN